MNMLRTIIFAITLLTATTAFGQFPKIPKVKDLIPKTNGPTATGQTSGTTAPVIPSATASTIADEPKAASTEAHILRRTLYVKPRRFLRYWKNPAAAEPVYDTWSWAPEIVFSIYGPVPAGSKVYVEWDTPDGKPWFTQRMSTPTLEPDYYDEVKHAEELSFDQLEKKAITTAAGLFPFRIKLKNAINGTDQLLFAGKYKLATYAPDQSIPEYKGRREFFFDEDWRLPMAWLWLHPVNNEKAPVMNAEMWFKGSKSSDDFEAFVFYNGKQIDNSRAGSPEDTLTNGVDEKDNRYSLRRFFFNKVRGFNKDQYNAYAGSHFLDKNPGEYEIKVVRNGELARSFKFTVGADGKVVDNGVARNNKVGGTRWIIPAKILGTADGKYNITTVQSDAFYGNTLTGFVTAQ